MIDGLILEEIGNGRYVLACHKPFICSALANIEKRAGSLRLILDASKPDKGALNSYSLVQDQVQYERVQDALNLIKPGCFMTKIDIKAVYVWGCHDPTYIMTRQWTIAYIM